MAAWFQAVGPDKTVYVGSFDQHVYAIGCSRPKKVKSAVRRLKNDGFRLKNHDLLLTNDEFRLKNYDFNVKL